LQWRSYDQLLDAIHKRGARVLLTGDWGDQVLFEQAYLVDLFRRGAWHRMLKHVKEFPRWFTDAEKGFFNKTLVRNLVRYSLPEALLRSLRRVRNAVTLPSDHVWFTDALRARARKSAAFAGPSCDSAATVHANGIYEEARAGYHYLQLERHNKIGARRGLETAFPFLDRDLVGFLMAIPGEVQTCDGVPKGLFRRSLGGLVPASILERRWKADPSGLVNRGVEQEFAKVVQYLDNHHQSDNMGFLNARVVREGLDGLKSGLRSPNCLTSWSIRDMLALELWLEGFFGVESHRVPERSAGI
jgi:asparagine synthetase B (glutamine-hydrolysing)